MIIDNHDPHSTLLTKDELNSIYKQWDILRSWLELDDTELSSILNKAKAEILPFGYFMIVLYQNKELEFVPITPKMYNISYDRMQITKYLNPNGLILSTTKDINNISIFEIRNGFNRLEKLFETLITNINGNKIDILLIKCLKVDKPLYIKYQTFNNVTDIDEPINHDKQFDYLQSMDNIDEQVMRLLPTGYKSTTILTDIIDLIGLDPLSISVIQCYDDTSSMIFTGLVKKLEKLIKSATNIMNSELKSNFILQELLNRRLSQYMFWEEVYPGLMDAYQEHPEIVNNFARIKSLRDNL